jgi:hypothetical protein
MAETFYIKRNDTSPSIKYQLDPKADLTGASVVFNMRGSSGPPIVSRAAATVVGNAADGVVSYAWAAVNTAKSGLYRGEFEVTYADGRIETFPNNGYIQVLVTDDLG